MTHFLVIIAAFLIALPAQAATLRLAPQAPEAGAGKEMVVSVYFESEGEVYNVVEGAVQVPPGVVIDRIDTAGSALSLFPEAPRHVIADGAISFVGGATTALPAEALLFTIHAHARNEGTYTFSAGAVQAYQADGEGTVIAATGGEAVVIVSEGAPAQTAPRRSPGTDLTVAYGQDPSVFEGAYFLALYGGDRGKGVERYEVREGWWRAPVGAEGAYVLRDQSLRTTLWVSAIAPDGSKTTQLVLPLKVDYVGLASLLALLALIGAGVLVLRRFLKP